MNGNTISSSAKDPKASCKTKKGGVDGNHGGCPKWIRREGGRPARGGGNHVVQNGKGERRGGEGEGAASCSSNTTSLNRKTQTVGHLELEQRKGQKTSHRDPFRTAVCLDVTPTYGDKSCFLQRSSRIAKPSRSQNTSHCGVGLAQRSFREVLIALYPSTSAMVR